MRGERDKQSVGLLICKSTDKTIVEWSLQDIQKPLGVALYQLQLIQGCSRCCFGVEYYYWLSVRLKAAAMFFRAKSFTETNVFLFSYLIF